MPKGARGAAILIPVLSVVCLGQASTSNWENVKAIAAGAQVRVVIGAAKPLMGTLESVTDTDFVLTQGTGPQSFARARIASVSVRKKDHRRRNALIGLGVGTGIGLAVGYGVGRAQAAHCNGLLCGLSVGADTAVGGVGGLVGGILAGVFWPTGGWRKVYAP